MKAAPDILLNHSAYQVIPWFHESMLLKCKLYRYVVAHLAALGAGAAEGGGTAALARWPPGGELFKSTRSVQAPDCLGFRV